MPEDESDADQSRDQPKASRRKEWRDKISRKVSKAVRPTEKATPELDEDVSDFLKGSGNPAAQVPELPPSSGLNPPASDGLLVPSQSSRPSTAQSFQSQKSHVLTARQQERRARKLRVQFTTAQPDIIGEGGDEAELPSLEVVTGYQSSAQISQPDLLIDFSAPDDKAEGNVNQAGNRNFSQELFLPESLQTGLVERKSTRVDRKPVPLTGIDRLPIEDESAYRTSRWSKLPGTPAKNEFTPGETETSQPRDFQTYQSGVANVTRKQNGHLASARPTNTNTAQESLIKPFAAAATREVQPGELVGNPSIGVNPFRTLKGTEEDLTRRPFPSPPPAYVAATFPAGNPERDRTQQAFNVESRETSSIILPPNIVTDRPNNSTNVDHFYPSVQHLNNVFRLAAQTNDNPGEVTFPDWIRACVWWFLKGRNELDVLSHKENKTPNSARSSQDGSAFDLKQAYIDLAKAWWIMNEILPSYIEREKQKKLASGDAEESEYSGLLEAHSSIQVSMQGLLSMMEKRQLFPPNSLLIQGADTRLWIQYPALSASLGSLLTNLTPRKLLKQSPSLSQFFGIPLMDTKMHFSFGKMFVDAEIVSDHDAEDPAEALQFPCILSIIRKRTSPEVEFTVVSQDKSINLHVQSNRKLGPTWSEVEWKKKSHTVRIRIARDLELVLRFWEKDFRALFGIYEYTCKLQYHWEPYADEMLQFEEEVKTFHYVGQSQNSMMFPTDPIRQSKIRIFQKSFISTDHNGKQRLFAGHRMVVLTPPNIKTSSSVNQEFRRKEPLMFKYLRGEAEAPAIMLDIRDKERYAMVITFNNVSKRAEIHSILAGTFVYEDETASERVALDKFAISGGPADQPSPPENLLPIQGLQWHDLQVVNKAGDLEKDSGGFSQHLRVCISCNYGTFTDRLNLAPGDLLLSLDITELTLVKLCRPPQESLTACFAQNVLPAGGRDTIMRVLESLAVSSLVRQFQFRNLKDLHRFQKLITGYSVHFDSVASSFSISRRRMVVPIYKRLEASRARLQIISPPGTDETDEKPTNTIQIIAFFSEDFVLGRSMTFEVKNINVLESFAKSGKFFVRFVDAKFAMPKGGGTGGEKEGDAEFVCLDAPEYPSEHDDIVIGFDMESERDEFANALPASVGKASRLGALGGALRR